MAADGTIKINTELDSTSAENAMSAFSKGAQSALKGVTVAIGAASTAMVAFAGYSVKVGSEFEEGMSRVSAISGATAEELKRLEEQAISLGASTAYSASEAAQGMENLASAGFTVNEIMEAMPGMLNLAASSGEDLATTSDIAASTLRGFNLEASQAAHVADVLAKNAADTNAAVYDTGEAMKYVAPVASSMGFSLEEVTASIGIMANAGIQGSQAGTTLRGALTRLVNPTDTMRNTMSSLSLSFFDAEGKMLSLAEMISMLKEKTADFTDEQKNATLATLFGQEALSGMLALIDAGPDQLADLTQELVNCDGAAKEMAETMTDNLKGSLDGLSGSVETFGIKVYDRIEEPLKEAVDTGTESINRLTGAFEKDGLNGVIEETGKIFEDLTDEIGKTSDTAKKVITPVKNLVKIVKVAGDTVLPDAGKSFAFLAENMEEVAVVTVTAYTAFKSYSLISKGTSASIGLVTKAQAALNAVMNANPAALVLSLVTALTAGLVAYNLTLDESEKSMYKLTEEQEKSIETLNDVTASMKEAREAREQNVQAIDLEYDGYEKLLEELKSITDENGNVAAGYEERARVIAEQLNQELGTEIAVADGKIEKYQEVAAAIEDVIQKKKAEALLTSLQEDMNNSYKEFAGVSKEYQAALEAQKKAKEDLEIVTQDYLEAEKKMKESMGTMNESMALAEFKEMEFLLKDVQKVYDETSASAYGYEKTLNSLATEVNDYNALQAATAEGDAAAIKAAMDELLLGYTAYTEGMLAESEAMRQQMYDEASTAVETLKMLQVQGGETYQAFGADAANAVAEIIDNFNQLPGGIAQGIKDIGPEASGAMAAALAQADLDGKLDAEGKESLEVLLTNYDSLPEDLKSQFESGVEGALEGLEGFDKVSEKAGEEGISFLDALREVLEINSPSKAVKRIFESVWEGGSKGLDTGSEELLQKGKVICDLFLQTLQESGLGAAMQGFGINIMSLFGDGITSQQKNTEAAGKSNAEAAKKGASSVNPTSTGRKFGSEYTSGVSSETGQAKIEGKRLAENAEIGADSGDGYVPGSDFGEGFVQGISGWLGRAANAAAKLALGAYNALRKALDEHSPSRKSKKSGKNFDLGLAGGISDNEAYAISAAEHLAENTLDALDVDTLYKKIRSLDASDVMSRVNAAVEDKQTRVANVVISGVSAKAQENYGAKRNFQPAAAFDYEKMGRIMSSRPVTVILEMDGKRMATKLIEPLSQELSNQEQLKRQLKGEW